MTATPLVHARSEAHYGGKAVALGAALRAGLPVPPGIALDVELVEAVAREAAGSREAIVRAFESLGGAVAVRSSAIGEDGAEASFAGQHLTVLNVTSAEGVVAAVRRVRESAHTDAARAYRARRGLAGRPHMAVVVQRLVDPDCAGVMFTRNPVDGRDERLIEAACGLGESVVAGLVTPDSYRLARDGRVLGMELGDKHLAVRPLAGGGTAEVALDAARAAAPCLGAHELAQLHELAARCEAVYEGDLDIEWVLAGGRAYLVQCRPARHVASAAA
jgi:pyruvate,water dikinase